MLFQSKAKPQGSHPFLTWTTAHKDVTERLLCLDPALFKKVQKVLDKNLSERHLRGGDATKKMYALRRIREGGA